MPQVTLTSDQKAQLIGWLNREKDHLLSILAMADRIVVRRVTGLMDIIKLDYDFVTRLRSTLRGDELEVDHPVQDITILLDVANANHYADKKALWKGIAEAIGRVD